MKNNDIISLNQWKKCNQTRESHNRPKSLLPETCKGKFIMPTEIDEKCNIEDEEDVRSGIFIG